MPPRTVKEIQCAINPGEPPVCECSVSTHDFFKLLLSGYKLVKVSAYFENGSYEISYFSDIDEICNLMGEDYSLAYYEDEVEDQLRDFYKSSSSI